jgi:nucleoside phosphorylase
VKILVLAALPEEADALLPEMGAINATGWPPVRRVEQSGHDLIIATTGIGKVNIASAAARLHALHEPALFLVIGTAGKLSDLPGTCFWLARAFQHDYGAKQPGGFVHYDPGAWPIGAAVLTPFAGMADPGLGLPHATIAAGDAFIEDEEMARHLTDGLGADLVDMETGAVAQFARQIGLPWAGIKAVTDDANQASAGDFHANLRGAARRAGEAAERFIALLP